uniref:ASCH domain-containing protein n=1 Tax=Fagus sylvatica TaxID=28930 RepID=A0A2N9J3V0_FAGSY
MSAVNLRLSDCMEELVKFTLESHINETLEFDPGLSKSFCSDLLKHDPNSPTTDSFEGVPSYPLYKRLASGLLESINSKAFCRSQSGLKLIPEGSSSKQEENEWQELVLDKGSEIVNILKSVTHELHVQEPFFSQLKDGRKTIEGRCAVGDYNRIGSGTLILFNKCVVFEVQVPILFFQLICAYLYPLKLCFFVSIGSGGWGQLPLGFTALRGESKGLYFRKYVHRYASFSDMLGAESLAKVLPGVETIEEGVQIYREFYTEEKEKTNGVLAIHVSQVDIQPYMCLATLLSGLSYGGVQGLLGLTHTTGTIPNALPPSRSTLISSFMLPYKPNGFNGDEDEDTGDGAKNVGDLEGGGRVGDLEIRSTASNSRQTVEEIFIALSGQSIAALTVLHYLELTRRSQGLIVPILVAHLLGFLYCTAAILQRQRRPRTSGILGKIGSAATALGTMLMFAMILPLNLLWMIAVACLGLLAVFVLTFKY